MRAPLLDRLLLVYQRTPPWVALCTAGALIVLVAGVDWHVEQNLSLGFFYIIPILIAAPFLSPLSILALAAGCSFLREHYSAFSWEPQAESRLLLVALALAALGMFTREMIRGRLAALEHLAEIREQMALRREAEEQFRSLIETSPAAIVTFSGDGAIELANHAAHLLLGVPEGGLPGRQMREFLPVLEALPEGGEGASYHTAMNCHGRRASGELFLACVWFATLPARTAPRLAAIITDASEDLRDWQESSLQNLLRSTRVLVGSVSHEIRNICAAISMVHANLGRVPAIQANADYAALGTLAAGLAKIATVEMQSAGETELTGVSLEDLCAELRIILEPSLLAAGVTLDIDLPPGLPLVLGNHHGLLQVLLNLARNSIRAVEPMEEKRIGLTAQGDGAEVVLRLTDSGPGLREPEKLFQPFQQGADAVGLGLYVSRAIVRACEGELAFEQTCSGCAMAVRLRVLPPLDVETAVPAAGQGVGDD